MVVCHAAGVGSTLNVAAGIYAPTRKRKGFFKGFTTNTIVGRYSYLLKLHRYQSYEMNHLSLIESIVLRGINPGFKGTVS